MKCYFCQHELRCKNAYGEYDCPNCPHNPLHKTLSGQFPDLHFIYFNFYDPVPRKPPAFREQRYQAIWFFDGLAHPNRFNLLTIGEFESIVQLKNGSDQITPQNILQKLPTLITFC